ncbi:MAG: peptidoglycan DD-metalloendopeptidase family protein [Clostridia bacterium]|nr:peptidoglycan DD-metalloendopeptidase family protein [Clostridia bacterium]
MKSGKKKPEKKTEKPRISRWSQVGYRLYKWNYGFGMYTLLALGRFFRWLKKELKPMKAWFMMQARRLFSGVPRRLYEIAVEFIQSCRVVFSAREISFKKSPFAAIKEWFGCIGALCRRYPVATRTAGRIAAPVAAAAVLILTITYWTSATFGIQVEYEGVDVGCISDETTYRAAAAMARERVHTDDGSFEISDTPKMTVTLLRAESMLTTDLLCDEILRTKGDAIAEGSGLYVDGTLVGSMQSRSELETVLEEIKKSYCVEGQEDRAEFIQKVELVDGLFLSDSVLSADKMKEKLTSEAVVKKEYTVQAGDTMSSIARKINMTLSELRSMNPSVKNDLIYPGNVLIVRRPQPFLRVKVVRTLRYTEEIPFGTEKEKDNTKYVTYEKVKVAGKKGSQNVVAEAVLIDGVEQSRSILSIEVTKQPVTKVVVVGTKKVVTSSGPIVVGDGVSTGSMLWPVPICHNMSRGWRSGHYALDIANGPVTVNRKPFIAADGGTVVVASTGWNGGYGNMIRIRHANGLETLYAHCHSIRVVVGQKVTRGQIIGLVGNTGRSTGPHLHFEVWKNGRRVNPLLYVKPQN